MFPDGSVFKGISLSGCFRWPVHNEPASTLKKGREGPSTVGVGHSHAPGVGSGPGRSPSPGRPSGLVPWPGAFLFLLPGCPFLSSSVSHYLCHFLGEQSRRRGAAPPASLRASGVEAVQADVDPRSQPVLETPGPLLAG